MKLSRITGLVTLLASLLLSLSVLASPSNKWRIQISESARSDGELVFLLSPKGGDSMQIVVPVTRGTSENQVAQEIRKGFQSQLDGAKFSVEVDDGEDVLIKTRAGQPDVDLKLASNTVESVRINLDRE